MTGIFELRPDATTVWASATVDGIVVAGGPPLAAIWRPKLYFAGQQRIAGSVSKCGETEFRIRMSRPVAALPRHMIPDAKPRTKT